MRNHFMNDANNLKMTNRFPERFEIFTNVEETNRFTMTDTFTFSDKTCVFYDTGIAVVMGAVGIFSNQL